jgi:ferrous iron transport protein B
VIAALAPYAGVGAALAAFGVVGVTTVAAGIGANAMIPGRQPSLVLELAPLRAPVLRHVVAKAWWRLRGFAIQAAPIMLVGSLVLGIVYETGAWQSIADAIGPATRAVLGLPAIAGVAIAFAFLRKELALQLLLVFAAVQLGRQASLGELMVPGQLFVYAVVSSISIPCVATLAALRGELGTRTAVAISAASLVLAVGVGAAIARVLGVA